MTYLMNAAGTSLGSSTQTDCEQSRLAPHFRSCEMKAASKEQISYTFTSKRLDECIPDLACQRPRAFIEYVIHIRIGQFVFEGKDSINFRCERNLHHSGNTFLAFGEGLLDTFASFF